MSNKITNREVFNLASKLQSPEIVEIKDTEFALAVYKNFKQIVETYNKVEKLNIISDEFTELTKECKVKADYDALEKVKANKKIFAERQKSLDTYNKALNDEFTGNIIKVKMNNLNTKLSVTDLQQLELMLII